MNDVFAVFCLVCGVGMWMTRAIGRARYGARETQTNETSASRVAAVPMYGLMMLGRTWEGGRAGWKTAIHSCYLIVLTYTLINFMIAVMWLEFFCTKSSIYIYTILIRTLSVCLNASGVTRSHQKIVYICVAIVKPLPLVFCKWVWTKQQRLQIIN